MCRSPGAIGCCDACQAGTGAWLAQQAGADRIDVRPWKKGDDNLMRLQKAMAQAGIASRRASERLIRKGRVRVNGQVVTEMGVQVDPERDTIFVDGRRVSIAARRQYYKLYKPVGYLSVIRDDRGRRALGDLLPQVTGVHPVGRLDRDSEGLLLLTDDGALTQRLTHPRYQHAKEYLALVRGLPDRTAVRRLQAGIALDEGTTAPARVTRPKETAWGPAPARHTWLRIVLREGKKRQIRRMCEAVGHRVERLIRVRVGPIELGDLQVGTYRPLTRKEVRLLRQVMAEG
jgi:pseudouridine synthase